MKEALMGIIQVHAEVSTLEGHSVYSKDTAQVFNKHFTCNQFNTWPLIFNMIYDEMSETQVPLTVICLKLLPLKM